MCGILGHLSNAPLTEDKLAQLRCQFALLTNRGPDDESSCFTDNLFFGFHRLNINGQDMDDGQPFMLEDCITMCNGEIYNHAVLAEQHNLTITTKSDCECIPLLYARYGFKTMVQMLEGVFAIALFDKKTKRLYLARDPVGIRPLFYCIDESGITFASEAKALIGAQISQLSQISQHCPGSYSVIDGLKIMTLKYIDLFNDPRVEDNYEMATAKISGLLTHAVQTRCANSDRPVGAFLSGGIDSSIVAMIAKKYLPNLRTFSIGLRDSKDLTYARIAAEAIQSYHTEVYYTVEEGIAIIPEICRILETSDITTIRASIPMYLLSKYIKNNTDIVVLLSGEGADEVFSGYLYNHMAPSSFDLRLDAEIRVAQLPWYDVLRADRTTASNGLEIRVPFLCKNLIRYAFSINPDFHNPRINKIEKKILRDAFHNYANENWQVIISRPKEAFSDGVGYSWKKGITDWAESNVSDEMMRDNGWCCPNPKTKEAYLYRSWYESYYPETYLVPHYWMPSWADHGDDPSATVLNIHKEMIE